MEVFGQVLKLLFDALETFECWPWAFEALAKLQPVEDCQGMRRVVGRMQA